MKMLWDLLDSIDPLPICSCTKCTCELTKSQEDRRLIEFLMKLNDGFEVIRGSILIMNPLPAISHVYRLLMQEENHKKLYQTNVGNEELMALAVNKRRLTEHDKFKSQYQGGFRKQGFGNTDSKGGKYNAYYCDHCKIPGHSIQRCYKLNAYPQITKEEIEELQQIHRLIIRTVQTLICQRIVP